MKKLLVILGVVLSTTDVLAANLDNKETPPSTIKTCSINRSNSVQVRSANRCRPNRDININRRNQPNPANWIQNIREIMAEYAPPDRGSPDQRGGQGGGNVGTNGRRR